MSDLEEQVRRVESKLLKLRQWDGQIWFSTDKSATTKEPIVVFVDGMGATIERVDHPDQRKQLDVADADSAFRLYLNKVKSLDQYVVFEVKPSGIGLFEDLVKSARNMGFDVGYDALEEDKKPHLSALPSIDEATSSTNAPLPTSNQTGFSADASAAFPTNANPVAKTPRTDKPEPVVPTNTVAPPTKSRWQRFLEWIGLR